MRRFALLLMLALAANAAEFYTGQAARAVVGQRTFTAQEVAYQQDTVDLSQFHTNVAAQNILGSAQGVAYSHGILVVVDSNLLAAAPQNDRVLIYKNWDSQLPPATAEFAPQPDPAGPCPVCIGTPDVVLGQPDFQTIDLRARDATSFYSPVAVATDGTHIVVADTNNNRVLIWNSIPTQNNQAADVVVGQPDFTSGAAGTSNTVMRGPQGVWLDDQGRLWVADTGNFRVLLFNKIPTQNGAAADLVLGQKDFNTGRPPTTDLNTTFQAATDNNLNTPVSVSTDGQRVYVADLGHNRVLIWNSIPTQNGQSADVVIGQKDMTAIISNNSSTLCASNGTDATTGDPTYPTRCGATLNFPRDAVSDGKRLFIADGGNDRVLVFNSVPTENGAAADVVLGQPDDQSNLSNERNEQGRISSADSFRAPTSLAWDGSNLYVADLYNRRVVVYTGADIQLARTAVRNAASLDVFATGTVTFSGAITANDVVDIKIGDTDYAYTVQASDTLERIINGLVQLINTGSGDPNVFASANFTLLQLVLTAKQSGIGGNSLALTATVTPTTTQIVATTSGATLSGGQDAAKIAAYTLVSIFSDNMADQTATADMTKDQLPWELGGAQVYFDGIRAPLLYVSPNHINAWMPAEVQDRTSVSAVVRATRKDGTVTVTSASGVPIVPQNPGIFGYEGLDPRPGIVLHGSSYATGMVSVDGTAAAGDTATVVIGKNETAREYTYTVKDLTPASGTVSFSGEPRAGDVIHLNIGDSAQYSYTVHSGDGFAEVIAGLVTAVNSGTATTFVAGSTVSVDQTTATGSFSLTGVARLGDVIQIVINGRTYSYTVQANDTLSQVGAGLVAAVNAGAGDPDVTASADSTNSVITLTAKVAGPAGNSVAFSGNTVPSPPTFGVSVKNDYLTGGSDAGQTTATGLVQISGAARANDAVKITIAGRAYTYTMKATDSLTNILDGLVALINAGDGDPNVVASTDTTDLGVLLVANVGGDRGNLIPYAVELIGGASPTGFSRSGPTLSGGHDAAASNTLLLTATGITSSTDTTTTSSLPDYGNDVTFSASIDQADSPTQIAVSGDTLTGGKDIDTTFDIRDGLVALINQDPQVRAERSFYYTRIRLISRTPGPAGEGTPYSARSSANASVILTATTSGLCCANTEDALVTDANPAKPGEQIKVLATGLGVVTPDDAKNAMVTGQKYQGDAFNDPSEFVSSLSGGKTANVINAGIKPGTFGIYEVLLELNPDLPTNPQTVLNISQDVYTSNTITYPVVNPGTP